MFCKQYDEALTAVALGTTADRGLARHLAECPSCQATLDEARLAVVAMDRDLRTLLSVGPAADFTARVTIRAAEPSRGHSWIHWGAAAAACATVLVAAAGALEIFDRTGRVPASRASGPTAPVASAPRVDAPAAVAADAPDEAVGKPSISLDRAIRGRPVRRSPAPAAPSSVTHEVIVEPGQVRAVRRLITAVAEGRFALEESRDTAGSGIVPITVQPIPVQQIEVLDAPAPVRPGLQGGE
jgi:hypothetical protein